MEEKGSKTLITVFGVVMIISGILALSAPFMMAAMMTTVIGLMLAIGGTSEMLCAFTNGFKRGMPVFIAGLLTLLAGCVVWSNPIIVSKVFTLLLVGYFILEGISRAVMAFDIKPETGWGWLLSGGILSILLGILFMQGWPFSGLVAVGVLAGIRLLVAGISLLTVGHVVFKAAAQAEKS